MTAPGERRLTTVIAAAGYFGLLFRAYVILVSTGSNDFHIWLDHAGIIREHGFLWSYANTGDGTPFQLFNHPPLPALYAVFCARVADSNAHVFSVLFKIPSLFAEFFTAALLRGIWQRRKDARAGAIAFAAYAFALGPIAVSAFHCNTDAVAASLALFACERSDRERHGGAGLALAAAMSVKLIPLLLAPLLFFRARSWRAKSLLVAATSLAIVPYLPFALHLDVVAKSTFGYVPRAQHWGFAYLFELLTDITVLREPFEALRSSAIAHGRDLVFFTSLAVGALAARGATESRRASPYASASVVMLAFLVFSPGFGVQYVIAAAPVLFAYDVALGFTFATLTGVFVSLVYASFLQQGIPYESFFTVLYRPGPSAVGLLAWGYGALLMWEIAWRLLRGRSRHV